MNKKDLRDKLDKIGDEKYRSFHCKLQPSHSEVIGVRMSELKGKKPVKG